MSLARIEDAFVVVVDMQPTFLKAIHRHFDVLRRNEFFVQAATVLGVPVFATEQNPTRTGGTAQEVASFLPDSRIFGKMAFSCWVEPPLKESVGILGRKQAVLIGIETHICVAQTAHHLMAEGYEVLLAEDCVSARTPEMHALGIERMRALGVDITHSESVVYEWMGTAQHEDFREVLAVVKAFS